LNNILFLSLTLSEDNRDKLTYNFIAKEMKGLIELGYEVYHFHPDVENETIDGVSYVGKSELNSISRLDTIGFMIRHLSTYLPLLCLDPKQALWTAKLEQAIGKLIDLHKIDVVHSHFMAPAGLCATTICQQKSIPVVSTMRGAELYSENKLSYGAMRSRFFTKAAHIAAKKIKFLTAPNREMQAIASETFNLKDVIYLPNGIESSLLGRYTETIDAEKTNIKLIAIGRLIYRKNYLLLLKAMNKLKAANVELTIVGEGELTDNFTAYIKEHNLSNVHLLNEVPKDEIYNMIHQADCLVHPSYIEGLPNVVIEALAIGKPCLLSKIGAHIDVIEHGVNGFYFDHEDENSLVSLIDKLLLKPTSLSHMAEDCRNTVQQFKLADKLAKYADIYQSLQHTRNQ